MLGMTPHEVGQVIADALSRKGLKQEPFAESIGIGQSTMSRIVRGEFKRMPSELPRICAALDIPLPELGNKPHPGGGTTLPAREIQGGRDFRVFASAEGGPGEVIRSADPMEWVPRPAPLRHVKDAYGMIISGDSMAPEYRPGETALVNPQLPIIGGEVYIFYRELDGEARAMIKELRRATGETWHLHQHNPPPGKKPEFTLSRKEWAICHRVIGKYSRA